MSDSISLELKNETEANEILSSKINLSITLPSEKTFRIREMLEDVNEGNVKETAESILRLIVEKENTYADSLSGSDLDEAATFILGEFGIPAHTKGYRYLKDALILVAQRPLLVDGITKSLYPEIAHRHGTTSSRVERVVRHAIESGCTKGDTQALYHYFPHSITKDKLKPTNAEFIAVMGDVVKKRVSKRQLVFADI